MYVLIEKELIMSDEKAIGFCVNNSDGTFTTYNNDGSFRSRNLGTCKGWSENYVVRELDNKKQALGFNSKTTFNF